MNKQALKKHLEAELAKEGYKVELLKSWPPKATYYKKDGEPMPNLPADPYSMEKYRKKGFSLVPPAAQVEVKKTWSRRKKNKEIINDVDDKGQVIQVPVGDYKKSLEDE